MQEPPLCCSASVVFALRQAIQIGRNDAGMKDWFANDVPMTVERV
ncbi:hypothetical protein RvY_13259 [Ramazzottius varieornatus]|uniref:Uncharacterized protein n=1 Tax=Ramazzottius varieornatus TaxID=947166 RepID=A0A1D1VM88_RAMVA|nr:hypothetical protein RvY_13259 [Ramazzottius varieornatus]